MDEEASLYYAEGLTAGVPEHVLMAAEHRVATAVRQLADRKRVLGQITAEQEAFVNDLLSEALP